MTTVSCPAQEVIELRELSPGWDPRSHFIPAVGGLVLEVGCGKGRFLADLSRRHPGRGHVGLELRRDRARKTAGKLAAAGVANAAIAVGPMELLEEKLDPAVRFDAIHLNFPDPWPKRRHARRRLIAPGFIATYRRLLNPGGRLIFVTDDWAYSLEGQWRLGAGGFVDVFGGRRCHWPGYPVTIHEEKFRRRGLEIWYQQFARPLEPGA